VEMEQHYLVKKQLTRQFFILNLIWPAMLLFGDLKPVYGLIFATLMAVLNFSLPANTLQKSMGDNPAKVHLSAPIHYLIRNCFIITILLVALQIPI
jgi:hypothetical protein